MFLGLGLLLKKKIFNSWELTYHVKIHIFAQIIFK